MISTGATTSTSSGRSPSSLRAVSRATRSRSPSTWPPRGSAEESGGLAYLAGLARDTPTAANIRAYADIVRERSVLRQLIRVSGEIAATAYENEGRTATELVDDAERRVFEIAEQGRRSGSGFVPLRDVLGATIDRLDLLHQTQGQLTGVSTGYTRPRPHDRRAAARRPRDRRGPPVDGQDDARAQHRRVRGHLAQRARRGVQHGNVARAARVPHDLLARTRRPEPPAHRRCSATRTGRASTARSRRCAARRSTSTTAARSRRPRCERAPAA